MDAGRETAVLLNYGVSPMTKSGVAQYLHSNVATQPHKTAAVQDGVVYSYAEINWRALGIASELRRCGVKPGDRVGLFFPNNIDYIASFFAATGIGAVVIPINPLLKSDEIAHVLKDSKAKAVIAHERGFDEIQRALPQLAELTHLILITYSLEKTKHSASAIQLTELPSHELTARGSQVTNWQWFDQVRAKDDLAVLIYTSGTTGKPKGAMLTHENITSSIEMARAALHIESTDKYLVVLPLSHIYGLVVVMLGMFACGGCLVVVEKCEPAASLKLIETEKVTILPAVPAIFQFFLNELEKNTYDLSSIRVCLSGASAMPLAMFGQLSERFSAKVIEGYGLSESSALISVNPLNGEQRHGSVGVLLKGVEVAIVSRDGRHLPLGKSNVGEIRARGPNIMQGYYGRPEETKEAIVEGWLRTGDLGCLDEDGYLYIVGRTKEVIIRGGQNIYPREIEELIARIPQVQEVAVIGVSDPVMGERVKAVIALRNGAALTAEEVKDFCTENLAAYKVPRIYEFIDALPRNSTGKVLKRLLQPS